jgi:hypothetical protein
MKSHAAPAYVPLNGRELATAILDDIRQALDREQAFNHNLAYPLVEYRATIEVSFWPPVPPVLLKKTVGDESARDAADPDRTVALQVSRAKVEVPDQVRLDTGQSISEGSLPEPSKSVAGQKFPAQEEAQAVRRLRIQRP